MIENVEEAYQAIAHVLTSNVHSPQWKRLILRTKILAKSCSGVETVQICQDNVEQHLPVGNAVFIIQDAVLFLQSDLQRVTGARIWSLTFTLHPTGKFGIEYGYDKPEGYEETDETIDLNDALAGLQQLGDEPKN